jgi:hypothetical protein
MRVLVLALILVTAVYAQRGTRGGMRHGGGSYGRGMHGGSVWRGNPGYGGIHSGFRYGSRYGYGFGRGYYRHFGGFRQYSRFGPNFYWGPWGSYYPATAYAPFGPYLYTGYGYNVSTNPFLYSYPEPSGPNITIVMAPSATPSQGTVIINNNARAPETAPPPEKNSRNDVPERTSSPPYIIALKDGTVWAAVGYVVQGQALHFLTQSGQFKQITLDQVDRALSAKLNADAKIDFHLP